MLHLFIVLLGCICAAHADESYHKNADQSYYSKCIGGQLLPSSDMRLCQIDTECYQSCEITCSQVQEIPERAICQRKKEGYRTKRQCVCCCAPAPQCYTPQTRLMPATFPANTCTSKISCLEICSTSVCTGNLFSSGEVYCVPNVLTPGSGTCECCCSCQPSKCPAGACGSISDGCGGTMNCGQCVTCATAPVDQTTVTCQTNPSPPSCPCTRATFYETAPIASVPTIPSIQTTVMLSGPGDFQLLSKIVETSVLTMATMVSRIDVECPRNDRNGNCLNQVMLSSTPLADSTLPWLCIYGTNNPLMCQYMDNGVPFSTNSPSCPTNPCCMNQPAGSQPCGVPM